MSGIRPVVAMFVALLLCGNGAAPVAAEDGEAIAELREDLADLVEKIDRLVDAEEPEGRAAEVFELWEAARREAVSFIFDEKKFPPASGSNWRSPGCAEAVRLGAAAERSWRALSAHLDRTLSRARSLSAEDARELSEEHGAAARALAEASDAAAGERPEPAPAALAVLAAAARDFDEAARRMRELPTWPRLLVFRFAGEVLREESREAAKGTSARTIRSFEDLNGYRVALGRAPLLWNDKLAEAARNHASDMRKLNFYSHDSPVEGRETESDRARECGYRGRVAENIYASPRLANAIAVWKQSASHHRTMLGTVWIEAGVSSVGPVTMLFGAGGGEAPPSLSWDRGP